MSLPRSWPIAEVRASGGENKSSRADLPDRAGGASLSQVSGENVSWLLYYSDPSIDP